ncbi:glycosyltransferase family 4 protein [Blastopirellula marina]|uniref:Glycosyl transferase family 1 domain-containing protein n=1 Tax=Blastopirellula marina TaxID=124 RepID=A0A2S8F9M8_9BACT|nr:glycosyltransferase family 4 protein [Blastopirellula marina]PQO28868.1 hypothetical protein C5Y98_24200 [Blastopirellula marina]PTL42141.1 glycosyltransferase family 1 protein [Blastopirellula marina]
MIRKLALITPWPDQRTGIADYAFDLAHGLADVGIELDVFTTCTKPSRTISGVRIQDIDKFPGTFAFDQTVYQMGNCSTFHGEQLPVLFENPGIVHLHDPALHHLIAFFLYRDDTQDYYRVLRAWYGARVAERVQTFNELNNQGFWDSPHVTEVPFFDPVLEHATGCIVHSAYAQQAVHSRVPNLHIRQVRQAYRNMQPPAKYNDGEVLQLGAFGMVQQHKHVDVIIEAVKRCNAEGKRVHLHVAGALESVCKDLPDLAKSLGIENDITFHGRLSEEEFLYWMNNVDICVSLRFPTMGETSAVVSRALQLGLPTIVNNVGWYAELPSCVTKLPTEHDEMLKQLVAQLQRVSTNGEQLAQWRAQCRRYAQTTGSFEQTIQDYVRTLACFRTSAMAA